MTALPQHRSYITVGGAENSLCFVPSGAKRRILIVPPLFDEMNRMRRTLLQTMRIMSASGIASCLPDLPGLGESTAALSAQSIAGWRSALKSAAQMWDATHIFSVRGGCLLEDDCAVPIMRLVPVKGASLVKTLVRAQIASNKESGVPSTADGLAQQALSGTVMLAGNIFTAQLWADLDGAVPAERPGISEMNLADIQGTALWLRAEPGYDAAMAAALAKVLDDWSVRA